jgi:hypothetical protein
MSFTSTDAALIRLRDQLVTAGAFLGLNAGRVHFPAWNPGLVGNGDSLPLIEITTFTCRRRLLAEGHPGLKSWTVAARLVVPATTTAADAENSADTLLANLAALEGGHIWGDLQRGDASAPSQGQRAAATTDVGPDAPPASAAIPAFRTVPLDLNLGLEP